MGRRQKPGAASGWSTSWGRSVIVAALDGVLCLDAEGRIVDASRAALDLAGLPPVLPEPPPPFLSVLDPTDHQAVEDALLETSENPGAGRRHVEASIGPEGARRPVELGIVAWREGGDRFHTVALRDLSIHRQLQVEPPEEEAAEDSARRDDSAPRRGASRTRTRR